MLSIHNRPAMFAALIATALSLSLSVPATPANAAELPSRPFLGVAPAPAPEDAEPGAPVPAVIGQVIPNGTGSALGLEPGDRIESVNGTPVDAFPALVEAVGALTVGDVLSLAIVRDGAARTVNGAMQARPRETSDAYQVIYGALEVGTDSEPSTVRTITYRPPGVGTETPRPAVMYIQGYTCGSVDHALVPELTMQQILDTLARAGYVVYKQEKPGVGDSVGPDCADIDFDTELSAFRIGLEHLRAMDFVDADHIHVFGHSLGGVQAPLLARDVPVRSIMAYGATVDSWRDYMLDIFGKQALIFGTAEDQAAQNRATVQPLVDAWLASDRPWDEIVNDPALQSARESGLLPIEGERVFGRSYRFFRGLNRYDLAEAWRAIDSHALAMHGSLDIQAIDASWTDKLVAIVNHSPERIGKAAILENAEHAFMRFESREAQLAALGDGSYSPGQPGERYDARAAATMLDWLNRLSPISPVR